MSPRRRPTAPLRAALARHRRGRRQGWRALWEPLPADDLADVTGLTDVTEVAEALGRMTEGGKRGGTISRRGRNKDVLISAHPYFPQQPSRYVGQQASCRGGRRPGHPRTIPDQFPEIASQ